MPPLERRRTTALVLSVALALVVAPSIGQEQTASAQIFRRAKKKKAGVRAGDSGRRRKSVWDGGRARRIVAGGVMVGAALGLALKSGHERLKRNRKADDLPKKRHRGLNLATSNTMFGLRINGLVEHYKKLQSDFGLDVLLLQEATTEHAETVRSALGGRYRQFAGNGLAAVYDGSKMRVADSKTLKLPVKRKLNRIERLYIKEKAPEQKFAEVTDFEVKATGRVMRVVNVHLDAGMNNNIKREQVLAVVEYLQRTTKSSDRIVFAGDTNAFAFRNQLVQLQRVLEPLAKLGVKPSGKSATKLFTVGDEPEKAKKLMGFVAGLIGDIPIKIDVVATSDNLQASRSYVYNTGDTSDHNIVFRYVEP